MLTLVKRNTKLYFRDKANLMFSMLAILIIVALFFLFMGSGNMGEDIRDSWVMAGVLAVAFGVYLVVRGVGLPDAVGLVQLAGLILLANITGVAILGFIVTLIKSMSVYTTVGTIIGTLSGFLMGIYTPIGSLPQAVQVVMVLFPPYHSAMLFRQILMQGPLAAMLNGASPSQSQEVQEMLGIVYRFGDFQITPLMSVVYLLASAILFYGLTIFNMRKAIK